MEEISLIDLLILLRHKFALLLVAAILGGGIGCAATYFLIEPTYTATASLYVTNQDTSQEGLLSMNDLYVSQSLVSTYIVIINSDTVLEKVAKQINDEQLKENNQPVQPLTAALIRHMITAAAINETQAFNVSITSPDPALAQKIVYAILDIAPDEIIRVVKAGAVEVIDSPTLPTNPNWPLMRNTFIGTLLGLVISIAGVLLYAMMDTVVHGEEKLTSAFNIPVLGVIPHVSNEGEHNRGTY